MRILLIIPWLTYVLILNGRGEQLDTNNIKQLLQQVESSFAQGHIYHINYSVSEKRTDAFYDYRNDVIKLIDDKLAANANQRSSGVENKDLDQSDQRLHDLKNSFERELSRARQCDYTSDYSLDGAGFFLKQGFSFITCEGEKRLSSPAIYASDGKITGIFYPQSGQAVIQPATERPEVPTEYWTDIVYRFSRKTISEYWDDVQTTKISQSRDNIVFTGDRVNAQGNTLHVELQVDQATLLPQSMKSVFCFSPGVLDQEVIKTWQYQDVSGMKWPKLVVNQEYKTDVRGKLNLEAEQTFVVNEVSFTPMDSKAQLAALLKSNYNVFDQITGTHYLSGNPGAALDNLSK